MVRKVKNSIVLALTLLVCVTANAQDPHFSQFFAAPLYLNPAMAGTAGINRVSLNYRNQFPSVNAYEQYAIGIDGNINAINSGIGLFIMQDQQASSFSTTYASLAYSYQLRVSNNVTIRPALKATVINKSISDADLIFDFIQGPNGPEGQGAAASGESNLNQSKSIVDFGAGLVIFSPNFYAGAAVDHLTEPNESFTGNQASPLSMKITAHVGAVVPIGGGPSASTTFSPNLLFQTQGSNRQLVPGAYIGLGPIIVGAYYRYVFTNSDAAIALIGLQQSFYRIGYSYDFTVSELSSAISGAHEVSLAVEFGIKKKSKPSKWRAIDCPKF
jgi:type IX secretion system PorP/SprF family membrane protein